MIAPATQRTAIKSKTVPLPAANVNRPNFLVIGTYKAGTTSLYRYLRQHSQLFLPVIKEVRFLTYAGHRQQPLTNFELRAATWPVTTIAADEELFAAARPQQLVRREVSPSDLAFPEQSSL